MTLNEQKNIFINSDKGQAAINYARKWFNDFNSTKLEPAYLSYFYIYDSDAGDNADKLNYDFLFWYWFNARYQRLMDEQQLAKANEEYEALMRQLESSPLTILGNALAALVTYAPYFLIGGFALWGYSKIKR